MASPLPTYPQITRATLRSSLIDRLNSARFWGNPDELNAYIGEALTVWQAHARYWRAAATFDTHLDGGGNSQFFYDLRQEIPQLAQTSTDAQVLSLIQYHLLEPQSGTPSAPVWAGTDQFPQDAYVDAITRRRDRFLLDTASVIAHYQGPTVVAGSPRVVLPASLIDVRRCAFLDANGAYTQLWRDDEFAAAAFANSWMTTSGIPTPTAYSVSVTPPYTVQLMPAPGDAGSLDLLAIAQGAPLDPATGVVLGTPDNYAWAIKYGAMADLLSQDGPGRDLQRAAYCESRYQEGVQLCKIMPTVVNGSINGNVAQLDSVFNFDAYSVNWHNTVGVPQFLGLAGQTLLATSCVPDPANPVGIGVDVVTNMPISDDFTPLGITADQAEVIIDEAQHIAIFKSGGAEFQNSVALHKNFVAHAKQFRGQSLARGAYWPAMSGSDQVELSQRMVVSQ